MTRSTRTRTNKRKPFGERSTNQPLNHDIGKKKSKKEAEKRKTQRRKSRQIGDDVIIFIQEKKSKSAKLHPAHIDLKTGGITFTPANRKTPIAYDRHRHLLIEKTPDGDEVEIELDSERNIEIQKKEDPVSSTNEQKTASNCTPEVESRTSRRQRSTATTTNYVEYSDEDSENSIKSVGSEFQAPIKTDDQKSKHYSSDSDSSNEKEIFSPARIIKEKSAAAALKPSTTFASPVVKTDWEEQSDWRCSAAIDY